MNLIKKDKIFYRIIFRYKLNILTSSQKNLLLLFPVAIFLFFSCSTTEQLTYLQDIDTVKSQDFFPLDKPEYKIQTQDILYVRFITLNEEMNILLNMESTRQTTQLFQNETSLFINGYTVNEEGFISIPIIGKVSVLDKTIDEATAEIEARSSEYLKEATLIVKLLSFKFSVLGEVNRPGAYRNFNNQLTVLEAISMAGDITDHGDRERILVLRPTKEGTHTYRINLKKKEVLASEAFFLLPNDIVIVEPLDSKIFKLNIPTMSFVLTTFFSTITTTLVLIRFFN